MLKKTLILAVCFTLVFPVNVLLAAPSGGQVVQGQANINQAGTTTTINQSSNRAIVNWHNFDIAKNESVLHNMPSASSAALHRVIGGGGASQLAGELKSNGNIFLVNPAGVVIHKGARIDTGGFMATTHDIANEDFMKGNYLFNKPGQPGASIINRGDITVRDQGFAALVAPMVRNEGVIAARLGKVALASGDAFKLDFYGDDLINFTVPESTVDGLHTTDGTPLGVENTGNIKAEGGVVLLAASQLDGVVASVVNNGGTVSAASAELKGGRIVFMGEGENVDVTNTGTVTASSEKDDGGYVRMTADAKVTVSGNVEAKGAKKGGQVDVSGKKETLVAGATISTEGQELGLIRLGGEFQGGKDLGSADASMKDGFVERFDDLGRLVATGALTVDSASSIDAGQDGTLIAWSEGHADLLGAFAARFLETSGKTITLPTAPQIFSGGGWLIDPDDIVIGNFDSAGMTQDNFRTLTEIDATWLSNLMANPGFVDAWVNLTAANTITVSSDLNGSGKFFELNASDEIIITADLINFNRINLFARSVTIENSLTASSDIMICKGDYFNSSVQIKTGTINSLNGSVLISSRMITLSASAKIHAPNGYVELVGLHTDDNSIDPANSVQLGNNVKISGKKIDIATSSLTFMGAALEADNIEIYGSRIYNPDHTDEFDEYVMHSAGQITFRPSIVSGSISASGDVWLITRNLSLDRLDDTVLISGASVLLQGDGASTVIDIPAGTPAAPFIRATGALANTEEHATGIHFLNGSFSLNEYSIQADNVSWASADNSFYGAATLSGVSGDGVAPHIFGVKNVYKDALVASWAFPTVRLSDTVAISGTKVIISTAATSGLDSFTFNAAGKIVYTGATDNIYLNINDLLDVIASTSRTSYIIDSAGSITLTDTLALTNNTAYNFSLQAVGDISLAGGLGLAKGNMGLVSSAGSITVSSPLAIGDGVFVISANSNLTLNSTITYSGANASDAAMISAASVTLADGAVISGSGKGVNIQAGTVDIGQNAKIDIGATTTQLLDIEADTFTAHANAVLKGRDVKFHVREMQLLGAGVTAANALSISSASGGKAASVVMDDENDKKSSLQGRDITIGASQLTIADTAIVANVSVSMDTDTGSLGSGTSVQSDSGTIQLMVAKTLDIATGSETSPILNSDTLRFSGSGVVTMNPYAAKAKNLTYSSDIKLVGKQGERTTEPHIFGLADSWFTGTGVNMLYDGMSEKQWPHPTVLLASASGAMWPKDAIFADALNKAQAAYNSAATANNTAQNTISGAATAQSQADDVYQTVQSLLTSQGSAKDFTLARQKANEAISLASSLAQAAQKAQADAVAARNAANAALALAQTVNSQEAHSKAMQAIELANKAEQNAKVAKAAADAAHKRANDALKLIPATVAGTPNLELPPPYDDIIKPTPPPVKEDPPFEDPDPTEPTEPTDPKPEPEPEPEPEPGLGDNQDELQQHLNEFFSWSPAPSVGAKTESDLGELHAFLQENAEQYRDIQEVMDFQSLVDFMLELMKMQGDWGSVLAGLKGQKLLGAIGKYADLLAVPELAAAISTISNKSTSDQEKLQALATLGDFLIGHLPGGALVTTITSIFGGSMTDYVQVYGESIALQDQNNADVYDNILAIQHHAFPEYMNSQSFVARVELIIGKYADQSPEQIYNEVIADHVAYCSGFLSEHLDNLGTYPKLFEGTKSLIENTKEGIQRSINTVQTEKFKESPRGKAIQRLIELMLNANRVQ